MILLIGMLVKFARALFDKIANKDVVMCVFFLIKKIIHLITEQRI